ncbi:hypothetical protein ES705_35847 [subsurface metagenome]
MGSHNKAATEVAAHSVKETEVHGVGASPVCSETEAAAIADDRIAAAVAAGIDADTLDGYDSLAFFVPLTVALFQANAATGTTLDPEKINDNDTVTYPIFTPVGDYCEIDFGFKCYIAEYRYRGETSHNGSGRYKIQYWSGIEWVDNTVDIPTRTASWSDWAPLTTPVISNRIRIVATTLDTAINACRPHEFEMRG